MKSIIILLLSLAVTATTMAATSLTRKAVSVPNALGCVATIRASNDNEEFGVVVTEDFSKFTKGTDTAPDETSLSDEYDEWIPEDYLNDSDLSGYPVYQAGGSAYIGIFDDFFGDAVGRILTPNIDTSKTGGLVATFRAKSELEAGDKILVKCSYKDSNTGYDTVVDEISLDLTSEWQSYTVEFGAYYDAKVFVSWTAKTSGFYIDDIEVATVAPKVAAPKAMKFSDYTGTQFTANWEAVEGATSYMLTVYTLSGNTERIFLKEEVEGTSCEVKNINASKAYYYYVQAKKDGYISIRSNVIKVRTVAVPALDPAVVNEDGFSVTWNAVPLANGYDFWAYKYRAAKAGETVVLAETNFDEMVSEGTVEKPEVGSETVIGFDFLPGWVLYSPVYINGAVGINNFYGVVGLDTYLGSLDYDLTGSDGKVKVDVDIYSPDPAAIVLFNYDEATGEFTNACQYDIAAPAEGEELKWNHHSVVLDGGSAYSSIAIYGIGDSWSAKYTYIDNLKVSVDLVKDQEFLLPINNTATENAFVDVIADMSEGNKYAYRLRAVHYSEYEGDETVVGEFSDLQYVEKKKKPDPGAVERVNANGVAAYVVGGKLRIVNPDGLPVAVYSVNGSLVSASESSAIELPGRGVYVVRIGNEVFKVVK